MVLWPTKVGVTSKRGPQARRLTVISDLIGRATTRGAAWLTLQTLSARVFSLLSQLILAWILVPSDFGLIGLATTVTTIARALVSFGIDDVLLQRQERIKLWQSSAFWTSLALSISGAVLVACIAPLAAYLYRSPQIVGLILVMASAMPIGALSTVSSVTIRSQMNFRFLAIYNTFEIAATQLLIIAFALAKFGPYSFALPIPLLAALKAILYWRKSPPDLSRRVRSKQLRYLANSGSNVLATRLLIESVSQGDYITLGILATHSVVGAYYFAFRIAAQPLRILAGNFSNVLFPALAQLNNQPERQKRAALESARLLSYIAMPACFLQAALAAPLLKLCFGNKWTDSIPLTQALSIGLPFDAVSWIAGSFMSARGEFRRQFLLTLSLTPVFFSFVIAFGMIWSATGVAWAVTAYYVVTGPVYGAVAFGRNQLLSRTVVSLYFGAPAIAGLSVILACCLSSLLGEIWPGNIGQIIAISSFSLTIYSAAIKIMLPDLLDQVLFRLRSFSGQKRADPV